MNTSAKGAAYEQAYRDHLSLEDTHREKRFWWPPKPRQHSVGPWDSMTWRIGWDDEGDRVWATEPRLIEFKYHVRKPMSCAEALRLKEVGDLVRPSFARVAVVHYRKEKRFCEH